MARVYKPLGELGTIVTGKTPKTDVKEYWDGDIPFITPTDVSGYDTYYQTETERYITALGASRQKTTVIPSNSVCVTCIGSTVGKSCLSVRTSITNQQINTIIPNEGNDYRYILYLLRYNLPYIQLIGGGSGSGTPIISKNKFSKFKFLVETDLSVQQRIASILSAYDKLIEINNKRIRILEKMAENLYKEWFVRFRFPGHESVPMENGLPKGWHQWHLGDLANVTMGQSPKSEYYNEDGLGMPFHQGVGSYGYFYLHNEIFSTEGNKIAKANSIIFSVRAPVGRINVTIQDIIIGRGLASICSKKGNDAFLLWALKYRFSKEDIIGNGAIFSSVTKDELVRQKIMIPDNFILRRFNDIATDIERTLRTITIQSFNLARQRDRLLPRLMSGKLEVKP